MIENGTVLWGGVLQLYKCAYVYMYLHTYILYITVIVVVTEYRISWVENLERFSGC